MRIRKTIAPLAILGVGACLGWTVTLKAIPYYATDRLFDNFSNNGLEYNTLSPSRFRTTQRNVVPMDNADTLTRAAMLDLSAGPVIFSADPALSAEYWSVSVFGHNTDTQLVRNDTDLEAGKTYRLLVRLKGQEANPDVDEEVVMHSAKGFLLVRAVMSDRTDPSYVERLQTELAGHRLDVLE